MRLGENLRPEESVLYPPRVDQTAEALVVQSGAVSHVQVRTYTAPKVAARIIVGGEWWPLSQVPRDAMDQPVEVVPLRSSDVADRNWSRYSQPHGRQPWPWKQQSRADFSIPAFGPWPNNFYHWVVEILPRVLFSLRVAPHDARVEILLPEAATRHTNFTEVLDWVVQRPVQVRTVARPVKFRRAIVSDSFASSALFQSVDGSESDRDTGIHREAFLDFQRALLRGLERADDPSIAVPEPTSSSYSQSVFLDRGPTARRPFNRDEVLGLMEAVGVQIVRPDILSTRSLGAILTGARVVIGPTGAGLTNIIFCRVLEKLIVLTPETHVRQGALWLNLSGAQGATTIFVSGSAPRDYTDGDRRPHEYHCSDVMLAMEHK